MAKTPKNQDENGFLRNVAATGKALTSGIAITGSTQAFKIIISFVQIIVLARLLSPTDFGLVAMVAPVLAFAGMLRELGLSQATIQKEKITHKMVSNLFWLGLALSLFLAISVALLAPFVATFFERSELVALTIAFSTTLLIWGLQSQPSALLSRDLKFGQLALVDIVSLTIGTGVAIVHALMTHSYWALFWGTFSTAVVSAGLTWFFSGFVPSRPSRAEDMKQLVGFGASIAGFVLLNFFARNADNILIARAHGADELGIYDRAYKLLLFPLQKIINPLGRVMVPFLSRTLDKPDQYRETYSSVLTLILFAVQPGILVCVFFSDALFLILLGERWMDAAPIFKWLGVAGLVQVASSTMGWLFVSQGRGKDYLIIGVFGSIISVASFVIGLPYGAVGVAAAFALGDIFIKAPFVWLMVTRRGPVGFMAMMNAVLPHFIAACVAAGFVWRADGLFDAISYFELGVLLALSYGIYFAVLILFKPKRDLFSKGLAIGLEKTKRFRRAS